LCGLGFGQIWILDTARFCVFHRDAAAGYGPLDACRIKNGVANSVEWLGHFCIYETESLAMLFKLRFALMRGSALSDS
jgi:hypothetical protein